MKPLVIYHANCTNGFGAAFAAWCKLGDDAEYLPMKYGDPLPPIDGRDVYVLDFSYPRQETELLLDNTASFTWLAHHKTAFEMYCAVERNRFENTTSEGHYILLDNNKSGALLAWEYFHPEKDVPYLISRIDDRDRWQFKFDDSKALHAGLNAQPFTFESWKLLTPLGTTAWASNYNDAVSRGRTILSVHNEQVQASASKARAVAIPHPDGDHEHNPWEWNSGGYWYAPGLAVNTPNNISEVGHELANASGTFGLVWYYDGATGRANCSLRSNGDYDVSAIAKTFGGGGHKNAAGFNIDMPTLLGWLK
jgi:hypothetical protein